MFQLQRCFNQIGRFNPIMQNSFINIPQRSVSQARLESLLHNLDKEFKFEKENYQQDEGLQQVIKSLNLSVQDYESKNLVVINQQPYPDSTIEIKIGIVPKRIPDHKSLKQTLAKMNDEELQEFQELKDFDTYAKSAFQLAIIKNKSRKAFIYDLMSVDSEAGVANVYYTDNYEEFVKKRNNKQQYKGSEFKILDYKLQRAFQQYLKHFKINENLIVLLESICIDKEQRLYMKWLENFYTFFKED